MLPKKQQHLPRTAPARLFTSRTTDGVTRQHGPATGSLQPGRGGSELPRRAGPDAGPGQLRAAEAKRRERQRGAEPADGVRGNGPPASPPRREGQRAARTAAHRPADAGTAAAAGSPAASAREPSGRSSADPRRERPPGPRAAAGPTVTRAPRPSPRRPHPQDVVALGAPAGDLDALRGAHGGRRCSAQSPGAGRGTPRPAPSAARQGRARAARGACREDAPPAPAAAPPAGQPRRREEAAAVRWPRWTTRLPLVSGATAPPGGQGRLCRRGAGERPWRSGGAGGAR